jgi:hypothetical protein
MKRVINLAITAAVAMVLVVCVEVFCWRRRSEGRSHKPVSRPPARLRVRTGMDRARATFAIVGALDEFTARLLACSVAQLPSAAPIVIDLSLAGPIRGKALAVLARVFAARRQIRLRGLGEGHEGLLALCYRVERSELARVLSFVRRGVFDGSNQQQLPERANAAA